MAFAAIYLLMDVRYETRTPEETRADVPSL